MEEDVKATVPRRRLGVGEVVQVEMSEERARPTAFTWRWRRYRIRAVEGYQEDRLPEGGRESRRLYRVRTAEGLRAVLGHYSGRRHWRMEAVLDRKGG